MAGRANNDAKGEKMRTCRGLTALKYQSLLAAKCVPMWHDLDAVDEVYRRDISSQCKGTADKFMKSVGGMCPESRFALKSDHCCMEHKTVTLAPGKRMHYCFHPKCKRFRHESRFYAEYPLHKTCIEGIEHCRAMPDAIKEARGIPTGPPPKPPKPPKPPNPPKPPQPPKRRITTVAATVAAPPKRQRKAAQPPLTRPADLVDLPLPHGFVDGPESPRAPLVTQPPLPPPPPSSGASTVATQQLGLDWSPTELSAAAFDSGAFDSGGGGGACFDGGALVRQLRAADAQRSNPPPVAAVAPVPTRGRAVEPVVAEDDAESEWDFLARFVRENE